jgi:hypothetical protein
MHMFGFLQGFAYGLLVSCLPWFAVGMFDPRYAVPTDPPSRWQVILRYWFAAPFVGFLLWITSLWGGFEPTLGGWLAGLAAIPVEIFVERRWRRWKASKAEREREAARDAESARLRAALEREEREAGLRVLDPDHPPADADEIVLGLCAAKRRLLDFRRPDLATQADRVYSRYAHVLDVIGSKFDQRELTFGRSRELVVEVCRSTLDNLAAMASLVSGVASIDADFVQRRLDRDGERLPAEERQALQRRLELVNETEDRLRDLLARNESALTALDDTAVSVAALETGRPQARIAADQALQDLRRFIDGAARYGRVEPGEAGQG